MNAVIKISTFLFANIFALSMVMGGGSLAPSFAYALDDTEDGITTQADNNNEISPAETSQTSEDTSDSTDNVLAQTNSDPWTENITGDQIGIGGLTSNSPDIIMNGGPAYCVQPFIPIDGMSSAIRINPIEAIGWDVYDFSNIEPPLHNGEFLPFNIGWSQDDIDILANGIDYISTNQFFIDRNERVKSHGLSSFEQMFVWAYLFDMNSRGIITGDPILDSGNYELFKQHPYSTAKDVATSPAYKKLILTYDTTSWHDDSITSDPFEYFQEEMPEVEYIDGRWIVVGSTFATPYWLEDSFSFTRGYNYLDAFDRGAFFKQVYEYAKERSKLYKGQVIYWDAGTVIETDSDGLTHIRGNQNIAQFRTVERVGTLVLTKNALYPLDAERAAIDTFLETHSLENATYGIYASTEDALADTNRIGLFTTNGQGISESITLSLGTYYVKELTSPEGFDIDPGVHEIIVEEDIQKTLKLSDQAIIETKTKNEEEEITVEEVYEKDEQNEPQKIEEHQTKSDTQKNHTKVLSLPSTGDTPLPYTLFGLSVMCATLLRAIRSGSKAHR